MNETERATPERLEKWKALCDKATPGPWRADHPDYCSGTLGVWQLASGGTICAINWDHQTGDHQPGGDMHFIAEARIALPACIAEIERLNRLLDEYRAVVLDANRERDLSL